jgi:hypothetical protein
VYGTIANNIMNKLDRLIEIIHNLKEEGWGSIANVVGNGEKSLGYNIETETPPVWKKKNNYAKGGKGSRRWWLQYLKQK